MDRVRQRLQDRLAEISEDLRKIEAKNAERLERWQEARETTPETEAEPAEVPVTSEEDDETRIERKRRTSALIEQLELARPEGMEDRGVRFRGR
jgi:hypothetical protein